MTTETSTTTMRAFAFDEIGNAGAVRHVPIPTLGEGEVLVRILAAGVNPFDLFVISGMAQQMMEYRFPLIPGVDAAGVIDQVGPGVGRFSLGDEVFGLFGKMVVGEGTFADYAAIPAEGLIARKPPALDFTQAAALPTPGLAALQSVNAVARKPGDSILIVGAAGGVGSFAVQMATRRGAQVIATGLQGQEAYLRSLGSAEVIDFKANDVVQAVRRSHAEGIEGLIDLVSRDGAALEANARVLRAGARLASTLSAADAEAFAKKGIQAKNVNAGMMSTSEDLENLAGMVGAGELTVPVAHVFSLEEAPQAIDRLASGEVQGKVVIDCRR